MLNMSQDVGELSRAFLAKVQGKAATCEFQTKCKETCCTAAGKSVDFTSMIVKYVLVNGLSDAEIRREVLGWKLLDESSLAETVAFIEQKEMARDAFKGEAAAVKTGYRKQHVTSSPSDEAKLRKRVKCEGCDSQINQFARARSGKLFEHKFCKPCWKNKNNIQRKDVKMSKVEATVPVSHKNVLGRDECSESRKQGPVDLVSRKCILLEFFIWRDFRLRYIW